MKLIGLSGTNGSGKDSAAEIIARNYNYLFVSASDMLRDEAKNRNLPIERGVLRTISAEWRREQGLGAIIDKAVAEYKKQGGDMIYKGLVIASIRNSGEADRVHELNGIMVWIDANPKIRYHRIYSRQRTSEDNKTYEQFLIEENAEMISSGDDATLDMERVKNKCDFILINESDSMKKFENQIAKELKAYYEQD